MNLAFVLPGYHTNLFYAFRALEQAGHRCHLLCPTNGRNDFIESYHVFDRDRINYNEIARVMNEINPDLVIIRKTPRLSKLAHRACLFQQRKFIGYDLRPYMRPRHLAQVLHGVIAGRPMRRFTPVHGLAGRPDARAKYIPFPVEALPDGAKRDYVPNGTVRVLCVAKLGQQRKNQFLLLRALEPLALRTDFRVTFVGTSSLDFRNADPAYYSALQRYATDGLLAGRVEIRTDVPFKDMPSIYRTHDVCVLPSRAEPLGIAILEAMAQGCAAVVSSDAGSAFYVKSAELAGSPCGTVFATDNDVALRHTLEHLLTNHSDIIRLGQNSILWARKEFSEEIFIKIWQQMVSSTIESGKIGRT